MTGVNSIEHQTLGKGERKMYKTILLLLVTYLACNSCTIEVSREEKLLGKWVNEKANKNKIPELLAVEFFPKNTVSWTHWVERGLFDTGDLYYAKIETGDYEIVDDTHVKFTFYKIANNLCKFRVEGNKLYLTGSDNKTLVLTKQ